MSGRLGFELLLGQPPQSPRPRGRDDQPARLLIMSDFSGRNDRESTGDLQTVSVDVDNFEDIFASFSPQVRLPFLTDDVDDAILRFAELDDFHPDALYQKLPVFRSLRELRQRLVNPATFDDAAAQLRTAAQSQTAQSQAAQGRTDAAQAAPEQDDQTLQRLLGREATPSRDAAHSDRRIDALIENMVAPYIVPEADPLQSVYIASLDEAIAAKMREILHAPQFQAMESTWRSLHGLITGAEVAETLKIHVLDVSKDLLQADFALDGRSVTDSAAYRLLVASGPQTAGEQAWSALAADFAFGPDDRDIDLLAALGAVAAQAGGPLLAAASPAMVGCGSLAELPDPRQWPPLADRQQQRWDALRGSPLAPWIGLALPRILCRLPYGKRGEEIDAFPFEELADPPEHSTLLWGSPAIAGLMLLARSAARDGWPPEPTAALDLEGLPAITVHIQGESQLYPCSEVYLMERAVDELLRRGLMPLVSFRNRNAARLIRFQSIADPPTALRFH